MTFESPLLSEAFGQSILPEPSLPSKYFLNSRTYVGFELELENFTGSSEAIHTLNTDPTGIYWATVGDGSLRENGREFVLRDPLWGLHIEQALEWLSDFITVGPESATRCSVRTGLHVHVNVKDLSIAQILTVVRLYGVLEPLILERYAPERTDNIFSNPLLPGNATADTVLALLGCRCPQLQVIMLRERLVRNEGAYKYSSLNLYTLQKYGSLEFRCFPATKDAELMKQIVRLCMSLVDVVKTQPVMIKWALDARKFDSILAALPIEVRRDLFRGRPPISKDVRQQLNDRLAVFATPSGIASKWTSYLTSTEEGERLSAV